MCTGDTMIRPSRPYTIRFPMDVPKSEGYREFCTYGIERLEPAGRSDEMVQLASGKSLWAIYTDGAEAGLYLDEHSYVITPDNTVYKFSDFSKLALMIGNANLERILGGL